MLGSEWLYGAIALLVGVHVLTILYAYRRRGEPAAGAEQSDPEASLSSGSDGDEREVVSCGHCGAINEHGYQFCRECVADLSAGSEQRHTRQQPRAH